MINQYRSKPIAGVVTTIARSVKAIQLTKGNLDEVLKWCGGRQPLGGLAISVPVMVVVGDANTEGGSKIEPGEKMATEGDYVVKWQDSFYVVKPNDFEEIYELI